MDIQRLISLPPVMISNFHNLEQMDPNEWFCGSDPVEKRVGSGGGTASLLASAYKAAGFKGSFADWLPQRKRVGKAEGCLPMHRMGSRYCLCPYSAGPRASTLIRN